MTGDSLILWIIAIAVGSLLLAVLVNGLPSPGVTLAPEEVSYNNPNWSKVQYDGHLFIVHTTPRETLVIHHPDCPCMKGK